MRLAAVEMSCWGSVPAHRSVASDAEVGSDRLEAWKARGWPVWSWVSKAQAGEPLAAELDAAKRHIGELSMEIELLGERARASERRLPLATRRSRR